MVFRCKRNCEFVKADYVPHLVQNSFNFALGLARLPFYRRCISFQTHTVAWSADVLRSQSFKMPLTESFTFTIFSIIDTVKYEGLADMFTHEGDVLYRKHWLSLDLNFWNFMRAVLQSQLMQSLSCTFFSQRWLQGEREIQSLEMREWVDGFIVRYGCPILNGMRTFIGCHLLWIFLFDFFIFWTFRC